MEGGGTGLRPLNRRTVEGGELGDYAFDHERAYRPSRRRRPVGGTGPRGPHTTELRADGGRHRRSEIPRQALPPRRRVAHRSPIGRSRLAQDRGLACHGTRRSDRRVLAACPSPGRPKLSASLTRAFGSQRFHPRAPTRTTTRRGMLACSGSWGTVFVAGSRLGGPFRVAPPANKLANIAAGTRC